MIVRLTKMRQMKDIGKIFENKLNDGEKEPSKNVWDKINSSLDTEKLRKKKILYTWLVGAGLFSLMVVFLLFNNDSPLQSNSPKQENNIPVISQSETSSDSSDESLEQENDKREVSEVSKEDSFTGINGAKEKASQAILSNEDSELKPKEISSETNTQVQSSDSRRRLEKTGKKDEFNDEDFTVSKNYHYYNSRNNKTIVTKNKAEIDSLVSEQGKFLDSLTTRKIDSLEQ